MAVTDASERPRSAAHLLTTELRRMIITGEVKPGQRILARDLEERFGVSHIPIREAMRALEGEGLLHYQAQRGAIATETSLAELTEIYDVRRFLECRAASIAAGLYDQAHLSGLRAALEVMEAARKEDPNGPAFFDAHHDFHWMLIGPGCSKVAERILRHLWSASDRYVHLGMAVAPRRNGGLHHRELYRAARSRDGERLGQLLDEHLHITEVAVRSRLQGMEPDPELSPAESARPKR